MPPAPYAETLRRFARDLSALRETQGVSIQRIHQDSKIPLHVLQDFEADALLGNPVFNRVYLRSLVKTYADALRLPPADVMGALERAYTGQYDSPGSLLGTTLAASGASAPEPVSEAPESAAATSAGRDAPAPGSAAATAAASGAAGAAGAATGRVAAAPVGSGRQVASSYSTVQTAAVLPARAGAAPGGPTTPAGQAFSGAYGSTLDRTQLPGWVPVLLGVLGLLAVIAGIVWWLGRSPANEAAPVRSDTPESTAPASPAARPAPAAAPLPPPVTLPDTLVLTVRAATAPLRGIRVRLDGDNRRPYWIEQGEAQTFRFRDSAFVTPRAAAAAFLLNGAPLDTAAVRAPDGSLRITRSALTRR